LETIAPTAARTRRETTTVTSRARGLASDILLAAQALVERCQLIARDKVFKKYGVTVAW